MRNLRNAVLAKTAFATLVHIRPPAPQSLHLYPINLARSTLGEVGVFLLTCLGRDCNLAIWVQMVHHRVHGAHH